MIKLIVLILLGVGGYFAYQYYYTNPFVGEWTFNEVDTFESAKEKIPDSQRYKAKRAVKALRGMSYKIEKDGWSMSLKDKTIDSGTYEIAKRSKNCRTINWISSKKNFSIANESCLVGGQMLLTDPIFQFENVFDRVK
ncbi:MAG: hypothetical protein HKM24_05560 [Gammaproteobacteria bacterium]|nr:hypothetical protein [Gammaproteobacteria bacterium]